MFGSKTSHITSLGGFYVGGIFLIQDLLLSIIMLYVYRG